jgi:hypothetical protein
MQIADYGFKQRLSIKIKMMDQPARCWEFMTPIPRPEFLGELVPEFLEKLRPSTSSSFIPVTDYSADYGLPAD